MRREELFSLTVEPAGDRAPGDDLEVRLTVPNWGGTLASGMSVRFILPELLTCAEGTVAIELEPLAPGETRTIGLRARLAASIESGTVLPIVAEVTTPPGRVVGSNIVIVRVISRPRLDRSHAAIEPIDGGLYRATVVLRNDGDACACDVLVVIPAPLGTTIEPGAVTIDRLAVGESSTVTCHIEPSDRMDGAAVVLAGVRVACSAIDPIVLAPASCPHDETIDLANCRIACEPLVSGRRAQLTFRATNAGSREIRNVALRVRVVPALAIDRRGVLVFDAPLVHASRRARTTPARRDERDALIPIGTLGGGSDLDVRIPLDSLAGCADQTDARVDVDVIVGAEVIARAEYVTTISSQPRFTRDRSRLALARDPATGTLRILTTIVNDGTAAARNVRLIVSGHATLAGGVGSVERFVGDLGAGDSQSFEIDVNEPALGEGSRVPIGAAIHADNAPTLTLESIAFATHGYAAIDADSWLAPNAEGVSCVTLHNSGSDDAHDVELTILACDSVTITPSTIRFDRIAAGDRKTAAVHVDDRRTPVLRDGAAIGGIVRARGGLVRRLDPHALDRTACVRIDTAHLQTATTEAIAGETIAYAATITLRGSVPVDRITFGIDARTGARYISGSTSINGRRVIEGPGSRGALDREITLRNVTVDRLDVAFAMQLDTSLGDGTPFLGALRLALDNDERVLEAAPVIVHGNAAIPVAPDDLGFALDGIAVGLAIDPVPVRADASPGALEPSTFASLASAPSAAPTLVIATSYGPTERATMVRYLRAAAVPGVIRHVLALRVLVADQIPGASLAVLDTFSHERTARKAVLDRLLIKLRIPGFAVEPTDLEDLSSRSALTAVAIAALDAVPELCECDASDASATVDRTVLRGHVDALTRAPLGATAAFVVLARLIGTEIPADPRLTLALRAYRETLIETLQLAEEIAGLTRVPDLDRALDAIVEALAIVREEAA